MFILILFICFFVCSVIYTNKKYSNPYKLIFIFGKKGAGKSCYMVNEMLKHIKTGWTVYTDMQDILIPHVRIIKPMDLVNFIPEEHSVLFLDEVGVTFDNRDFSKFPSGLRDFFKFQRKYKLKVYMNSQAFDVDKKIRDVTDSMILQTSIMNVISISRPIKRSITLTEPSADKDSRIADKLSFDRPWHWKFYWMPRYFKYFDSYAAPERQEIPYKTIDEEISIIKKKTPLLALKSIKEGINEKIHNREDEIN